MVRGLDIWKEYFSEYTDNYVLIGGAACHWYEEDIEDGISSLSAILMDDDYYHFTIEHSNVYEGIHFANIEAIICLKAKAYLDLLNRKKEDKDLDSNKIEKHKKDVIRLAAMLPGNSVFEIPESLQKDIADFCNSVQANLPNKDFMKYIGLRNMNAEDLIASLKQYYGDIRYATPKT